MVLQAKGNIVVWANGEPRVGDPYSNGDVRVPVAFKKGANELLFVVLRGRLEAKLSAPRSELFFNTADTTLPDLTVDQKYDGWGAVPVINATPTWQHGLTVVTALPGGEAIKTELPALPPLSVSKVPFQIVRAAGATNGTVSLQLELVGTARTAKRDYDKAELSLRVLKPEQTYKRTFRSQIDGSIQVLRRGPAGSAVQNCSGSKSAGTDIDATWSRSGRDGASRVFYP